MPRLDLVKGSGSLLLGGFSGSLICQLAYGIAGKVDPKAGPMMSRYLPAALEAVSGMLAMDLAGQYLSNDHAMLFSMALVSGLSSLKHITFSYKGYTV